MCRRWCLWVSRVSISHDDTMEWGGEQGDVVKIQELACERQQSHTDYITSIALIDIAPLGSNAVTESLVPKNSYYLLNDHIYSYSSLFL